MLTMSHKSRQPIRIAWSHEQLLCECAIAIRHALDNSTLQTYNSHLQSYLSFCKLHDLPLNPTLDTLSFYIIFMAHHIKPNSVLNIFLISLIHLNLTSLMCTQPVIASYWLTHSLEWRNYEVSQEQTANKFLQRTTCMQLLLTSVQACCMISA